MLAAAHEVQQLSNASDVQLGRQWARGTIDAGLCYNRSAEAGSLISTAFVARDLMQVAEALEEDGLLRYWGKHLFVNLFTYLLTHPNKGTTMKRWA